MSQNYYHGRVFGTVKLLMYMVVSFYECVYNGLTGSATYLIQHMMHL